MNEPIWILHDAVLAIQNMLISEHGGLHGIRDSKLLDSALARPRQKFLYDDKASIFDLAASYSFGLARNHPFIDGNKRIALTVGAVFLELNGYSLNASEAEAVIIFSRLASGELDEDSLSKWLRESSFFNA